MASVSAKDLPVHSAMLSIQLFFGLLLLRLPSTVPCSITLVRPSDLVTCPYHFSFRRFTVFRRSSYGPMIYDGFPHMLDTDSVFVGDAKDLSEGSKL